MRALLLVGGYATRLIPLSLLKPKCFFPLRNNPLIELTTEGLIFLLSYITEIITLKILTPKDLNCLETIFSSLGPFSNVFLLFIQTIRKLSGYN
jgi:dTDP-glucose pyrophosphorylase